MADSSEQILEPTTQEASGRIQNLLSSQPRQARTFLHLSQFTLLDFDFNCDSPLASINPLYICLPTRFGVHKVALPELRSRETCPIGLALPNCSFAASYSWGTEYSFQYKPHHDSVLLYIIILGHSHIQWTRRLRWSGPRSRQHFGRYTWRKI